MMNSRASIMQGASIKKPFLGNMIKEKTKKTDMNDIRTDITITTEIAHQELILG